MSTGRSSAFIVGERVVSLSAPADEVRARLARGLPLLVQFEETITSVPAEQVERVEEGWDAYAAAIEEGFRELHEQAPPPHWRGAVVHEG